MHTAATFLVAAVVTLGFYGTVALLALARLAARDGRPFEGEIKVMSFALRISLGAPGSESTKP